MRLICSFFFFQDLHLRSLWAHSFQFRVILIKFNLKNNNPVLCFVGKLFKNNPLHTKCQSLQSVHLKIQNRNIFSCKECNLIRWKTQCRIHKHYMIFDTTRKYCYIKIINVLYFKKKTHVLHKWNSEFSHFIICNLALHFDRKEGNLQMALII